MSASAPPSIDPSESAVAAGLRYVTVSALRIRRKWRGKGFVYLDTDGKNIRDPDFLKRVRSLAIPPAWADVCICPSPNGHLQAVGRDARGRKQYRYHPRYRQVRDEAKFSRMPTFGAMLPRVRHHLQQDLEKPGLPKEKVVATVVRLLETTFIRVGNEEYAKDNQSFGLATMRNRHVQIDGTTLRFHFRGKSGVEHDIELTDRRLARIVKHCRDLPGYELFQYLDETGALCHLDSADVNEYLHQVMGQDFTAKDFRTWAGTVLCACELGACGPCGNAREFKSKIIQAVKRVAERLGNRPATCRKYYIHPAVMDAYEDGTLSGVLQGGALLDEALSGSGLRPQERTVLTLIARPLKAQAKSRTRRRPRAHSSRSDARGRQKPGMRIVRSASKRAEIK